LPKNGHLPNKEEYKEKKGSADFIQLIIGLLAFKNINLPLPFEAEETKFSK
jgi:hypothetical protein